MNAMNRILVLIISIGLYSDTLREVVVVKGDSLHPRRPKTEEAFIAIGHHESSNTVDEMNAKIKTMEDRRKKVSFLSIIFLRNSIMHANDRLRGKQP